MIHSTPASLKYFLLNGNKTLLLSNKLHFTYPLSMKKILVLIFALFCYSSCEKFENCIEIEDYINGSYTDEFENIILNLFQGLAKPILKLKALKIFAPKILK